MSMKSDGIGKHISPWTGVGGDLTRRFVSQGFVHGFERLPGRWWMGAEMRCCVLHWHNKAEQLLR